MALAALDPTLIEQHNETFQYGTEIIRLRKTQPTNLQAKPPAWTPYRNFLYEALEYVAKGEQNESIQYGLVTSCIVDRDCGPRTYLDSEIIIFEAGAGLTGRRRTSEARRERIWEAWRNTQYAAASVIVILGRNFPSWTIHLPPGANYAVLDHFRVTNLWRERDDAGNALIMVRLQKHDLQSPSWWTPNQPLPPAKRVVLRPQHAPLAEGMPCPQCGTTSPRVYRDNWMCLMPTCDFFWTPTSAISVAAQSSFNQQFLEDLQQSPFDFDEEYLRWRSMFDRDQRPSYALVPNLIPFLEQLRGTQASQMRLFYRGLVCPNCANIVPKIQWHQWECGECRQFRHTLAHVRIELNALVSRYFVNYSGHPPFLPERSEEAFGARRPSQHRHTYKLDKWEDLHAGCRLLVISPTNNFNVQKDGPDAIYYRMLEEANVGRLGLHRVKDPVVPTIDNHFHETYGANYGFSSTNPSKAFDTAPESIHLAKDFLDRVARWELKSKFCNSNSVQALAYMEGMDIGWHTDGENELGATVSTLSLGGDATFHLRMKRRYYENEGVFEEDREVARGAKNWRVINTAKERMRRGEDVALRAFGLIPAGYQSQRPELKVPLIHGSIVIMQGEIFSEFYEHKVVPKGPLRFAVTTRFVDEAFHYMCPLKSKRPNGQLFTEESEDSDIYDSSSESPRITGHRPLPAPIAGTKRRMDWDDVVINDDTEDGQDSPGNGAYWTEERRKALIHYRDVLKVGYDEISAMPMFEGKSKGSMRTAAERERSRRKREGIPTLPATHTVMRRQPTQSASPRSQIRATTPGDFGEVWTDEEANQLWEMRSRDPQPTYNEIATELGNKRTPKAYREKYALIKAKREGRVRAKRQRVESEQPEGLVRGGGVAMPSDRVEAPVIVNGVVQQPGRTPRTRSGRSK